jgi:hypothetical protein
VYTCVELLGVYACADGELLQLLMLVLARHMDEAVRAGREVQEEKMSKVGEGLPCWYWLELFGQ